jgi:hypothetical protein
MGKVKPINPLDGTDSIPAEILQAQGGEIKGFKCVGAFVAPPTPTGNLWRVGKLTAVLKNRMEPLARVDQLELARKTDGKHDVSKLRYDMLRFCAHAKTFFYMRCMPPHITELAIAAAVKAPLRASFELVANADPTPPAQTTAAWEEATLPQVLPLHMAGVGIGGHERVCPAAYVKKTCTF